MAQNKNMLIKQLVIRLFLSGMKDALYKNEDALYKK
jgi:hypothetical protein